MQIDIKTIDNKQEKTVDISTNLLHYLSQIVLSRIDDEIKDKQLKINKCKKIISTQMKELKLIKQDYDKQISFAAIEKQKSNIISLLASLNTEGVIIGNTRKSIIEHLKTIDSLSYEQLIKFHQKLTMIK